MDFREYSMRLDNRDTRAKPSSFDAGQANLALFTDLYELKMLQAYVEEGMTEDAVFSLFVRRLPSRRNFLLACGLETVIDYLENLLFTDEEISFLASLGYFSDRFLAWLRDFAFRGDVYAVPEGTPLFPNEPILEVKAPLPEAQLVETFIMNQIHTQTMLASKAQRVVNSAEGRPVIDFGARRMHGIDTSLKAARAFYIAGVAATSNVLAGKIYDIPVSGTMAHSYIQAHKDEASAFLSFVKLYPDTILLVDTYDTIAGVRNVIDLSKSLGKSFQVSAVRLDSGDLLALSKEARRLLDDANLNNVQIFASGGLDEYTIAELLSSGAPIDGFGVGTHMGVSSDAPDLDIAYKLCEYAGKGRLKLSAGKPVFPGRKQIFRVREGDRDMRDIISRADEDLQGSPLLSTVMRNGRRLLKDTISLESLREYAKNQISLLPENIRAIAPAANPYPVEISQTLSRLQDEISKKVVR
jgi:nicotinate phosphoribosyltransferase